MDQTVDWEDVIGNLYSDKARYNLINRLIEETSIDSHETRRFGFVDRFVQIVKKAKDVVVAFELAGWYYTASLSATAIGMPKLADKFGLRLLETYENIGAFGTAANYAEMGGMEDRAKFYRRIEDLLKTRIK